MISTSGKHVLLIGHVFIVSSAAPNVTRETSNVAVTTKCIVSKYTGFFLDAKSHSCYTF